MQRLLSGNWDPYPIDMSFEPPCMVDSLIGLKQPGQIEAGARATECANHLHQLHVCLPARRGHTRLLYRMSLDFLPWLKHVPGIQRFWNHIAGQARRSLSLVVVSVDLLMSCLLFCSELPLYSMRPPQNVDSHLPLACTSFSAVRFDPACT